MSFSAFLIYRGPCLYSQSFITTLFILIPDLPPIYHLSIVYKPFLSGAALGAFKRTITETFYI
jgi:hypothetical protein